MLRKGLLLLACSLCSAVVLAKPTPVFHVSQQPPPGFSHAAEAQTKQVDVYYDGLYVGQSTASFTATHVELTQPEHLVALIPGLVDADKIVHALSGQHANHFDASTTPTVAAVNFDPEQLRMDVLINSDYVAYQPISNHLIPASDAGFSWVQQINGATSGTSNEDHSDSFNVIQKSVLAYQQARLNSTLSIAKNGELEGANASNARFEQLNAEWQPSQYKLQGGVIRNVGSVLLTEQDLLGVSFSTSLDTVRDLQQVYGSQLEIFLPNPSQVSIFRKGRLLSSAFYPAGNQLLDTSTLPNGAYDVTLKIRNNQGSVREETRFYIKTEQVPPMAFPQYYANIGMVEMGETETGGLFPRFSKTPIYQLGASKRIRPSWGFSGSVTGSDKNAFFGAGVFFLTPYFHVIPQLIVGTDGDSGIAIAGQANIKKLVFTFNGRQIWGKDQHKMKHINGNQVNEDGFDPLTQNIRQLNLDLHLPLKDSDWGFLTTINKTENKESKYSYGPLVHFYVFQHRSYPSTLTLSATQSEKEFIALAQISTTLGSPSWQTDLHLGQRAVSIRDDHLDDKDLSHPGTVTGIRTTKRWMDDYERGLELSATANHDAKNNNIGASGRYSGTLGTLNGEVNRNSGSTTDNNTQFAANYENVIAYSEKKIALGGHKKGDTGVIVNIKDNHNGDQFDVYANNKKLARITSNQTRVIFLKPFKTYLITIKPVSDGYYSYSRRAKRLTLYKGNFKTISWKVSRDIILHTRVIDKNGNPVTHAKLKHSQATTDNEGYLQAQIPPKSKQLTLEKNNKTCHIKLPQLTLIHDFVAIEHLNCD